MYKKPLIFSVYLVFAITGCTGVGPKLIIQSSENTALISSPVSVSSAGSGNASGPSQPVSTLSPGTNKTTANSPAPTTPPVIPIPNATSQIIPVPTATATPTSLPTPSPSATVSPVPTVSPSGLIISPTPAVTAKP